MAAIDYSSIIMQNGKPVEDLTVGPYRISAYKYGLIFENCSYYSSSYILSEDDILAELPDAADIRTIQLVGKKDIKRYRKRGIKIICCDILVHIFKIADCTIIFFPFNPAWGGASYCYFLGDNGSLSAIATGYGHYANPALHWINRDLSKGAEEEITKELWQTMTSPKRFCELLVEQVFQNKSHHIDGSIDVGGFKEDTITDPAILALYSKLQEE